MIINEAEEIENEEEESPEEEPKDLRSIERQTSDIIKSDSQTKRSLSDTKQWFREKINQVMYPAMRVGGMRETPNRFYYDNREHKIFRGSQIKPGSLYCWFYDPKYKRSLPYYDAFPVAFVLSMYNNGFLGINLHYLPLRARATLLTRLFDNMMREKSYGKYLDLQYRTLQAASQYREVMPCIKRYLISHVRGQMIEIPTEEWIRTIFLPLESFQKRGAASVWSDSLRKARQRGIRRNATMG